MLPCVSKKKEFLKYLSNLLSIKSFITKDEDIFNLSIKLDI